MRGDGERTPPGERLDGPRYEIEIEQVPEQAFACLAGRGPIDGLPDRGRRLAAALAAAGVAPAGPLMARYPAAVRGAGDVEFEVCLPIAPRPDGSTPDRVAGLPIVLIPSHHAMVARHHGPWAGLPAAHHALDAALRDLGYRRAGPVSEVYLVGPAQGVQAGEYLTEVRYPYAR